MAVGDYLWRFHEIQALHVNGAELEQQPAMVVLRLGVFDSIQDIGDLDEGNQPVARDSGTVSTCEDLLAG